MKLLQFPNELFLDIASHLPDSSVANLTRTSHAFNTLFSPFYHERCVAEKDGLPALSWAVLRNHLLLIQYLINCGVDASKTDAKGSTALHHLCKRPGADVSTVTLLCSSMKDINAQNGCGETALHLAVERKNILAIRYLLSIGANINLKDNRGRTPLHYALIRVSCTEQLVKELESHGTDINIQAKDGRTPISAAIRAGYDSIAIYLLDKGADTTVIDENSSSLLHYAAASGNLDIINRIGGDVNMKNKWGDTPLIYAVRLSRSALVVERLLDRGADVNESGRWGITPLHWAARNVDLKTAKMLGGAGAYIRSTDTHGYTALDYVGKYSSHLECWLNWLADQEW